MVVGSDKVVSVVTGSEIGDEAVGGVGRIGMT